MRSLSLSRSSSAPSSDLCVPSCPSSALPLSEGDSPSGVGIYAGFGLTAIAFFLINPASLTAGELAVLALVMFAAGNGKVWTRSNEYFFPMYAGLAAVSLIAIPARTRELRSSPTARRLAYFALAFLLWIVVCGWQGEDPGRTDELFARLAAGAVAGYAAARVLTRDGVARALTIAALCGAVVFLAIPAVYDAVQVLELGQILRVTRLRLFSLHPNLTGTFLAAQLVLVSGLLLSSRGWRRVTLLSIFLATLPALYLTRSRTAWIAALVGLAVLVLARRMSRRVWGGLTAAAIALFLAVLLIAPLREAVLRPSSSSQSLSQRIYLWDASARLVAENPLRGIGLNNYFAHGRTAVTPSYYDNTDKSLHPHNLLLAVAEGSGLIGLALFLCLIGLGFTLAIRAAGRDSESSGRAPPVGAVLLATLATLLGANMFDLGLSQTTFVPTLFWLIAGMVVALESDRGGEASAMAPSGTRPAWRLVAAAAFALLFAVRPFLGERYFQKGVELQSMENPEPALEAWERARLLMPWATAPLIRSAQLATSSGNSEEARALYTRAIELAPTYPRYRYRYALLLSRMNKPVQALEQIERALELDPHSDEEGRFRLLYAELLARTERGAEAREQLKRVVLAMPDEVGVLENMRWQLPVRGGEPISIRELAIELGQELVAEAPTLVAWEIRRRGNHLCQMLRELGATDEALLILEGVQESAGTLDISLMRLLPGLRSELGLEFLGDEEFKTDKYAGRLIAVDFEPLEAMQRAELGLAVSVDIYFERTFYHQQFGELYETAVVVGDDARVQRAIEGLLYFADVNSRVKHAADYAGRLVSQNRGAEALAYVAHGLAACDEVKLASHREQRALELARTALSIARRNGRSVPEQIEFLEDSIGGATGGVSRRLFWIVCLLNLAKTDRALEERARESFANLRARYPAEGVSLTRYFDETRAEPSEH